MTTDELRVEIERYRSRLKKKSGLFNDYSKSGPVTMSLIDAIVETLETQQTKIDELESMIKNSTT